ncbi:MAG: serine dehydratase beta chain [Liquorilactobacillus ghanensis]|uniref:serine dehydratase beta chain n=1 Tax=Liquorilactobacillus ghanensis TaxID=399370 RepID=UPI0039ED68FA
MKQYQSVFDIIGPVMIGPSSSHTAGALAIGQVAYKLFTGRPQEITIHYYESFAATHQGHGTDFAIIAGSLGLNCNDQRILTSIKAAQVAGIKVTFIEEKIPSPIGHPNTALIKMVSGKQRLIVCGCSIGGGKIEVPQIEYANCQLKLGGILPIALGSLQDVKFPGEYQKVLKTNSLVHSYALFQQDANQVLVIYLKRNPTITEQHQLLKTFPKLIILEG